MAIEYRPQRAAINLAGDITIETLVYDTVTNRQATLTLEFASGTGLGAINAEISSKAAVLGGLITEEP